MFSLRNIFGGNNNISKEEVEEILAECGQYQFWELLSYRQLNQLYQKVSPISQSIDDISNNISRNFPVLIDKKTGEEKKDHPFLQLLENPNQDLSYQEFIILLIEKFLKFGDVFVSGTSMSEKGEFKNIYVRTPENILVETSDVDNYPNKYILNRNQSGIEVIYRRNNLGWRFLSNNSEMMRIKSNDDLSIKSIGKIQKCIYEVWQYLMSSEHNVNLLKNGARIMGLLTLKGNVSNADYNRLTQRWKKLYSGTSNAGKTAILRAEGGMDYKEMGMNNRDLDMLNSRADVRKIIYKQFGRPLALVEDSASTFNNVSSAKLEYFNDTILPLAQYMLDKLWWFASPRYKDGDKYNLKINKEIIPIFQESRIDVVTKKSKQNIYTINELRIESGLDELNDGRGEEIVGNSSNSDLQEEVEKEFNRIIEKNVDNG